MLTRYSRRRVIWTWQVLDIYISTYLEYLEYLEYLCRCWVRLDSDGAGSPLTTCAPRCSGPPPDQLNPRGGPHTRLTVSTITLTMVTIPALLYTYTRKLAFICTHWSKWVKSGSQFRAVSTTENVPPADTRVRNLKSESHAPPFVWFLHILFSLTFSLIFSRSVKMSFGKKILAPLNIDSNIGNSQYSVIKVLRSNGNNSDELSSQSKLCILHHLGTYWRVLSRTCTRARRMWRRRPATATGAIN